MRRLLRGIVVSFLLVAGGLAQSPDATQSPAAPEQPGKEKSLPKGVIHEEEVKEVPVVHATEPCNNFSWGAALEAVLASQKVDLKQESWIDKYYGGDVCLEDIGSPDTLIKNAEGEYVLDDGRHVQLTLEYFSGLPANSSALLVPIMTGELLILFVDGKAEVLTGAKWDDYLSKRGERLIDLQELHLNDPTLPPNQQRVIIETSSSDLSKITGFMKVKATEVHQQYWPK